MNVRRIAFAPLYVLADWANDNPISALGVSVALGALSVLLVSASIGSGVESVSFGLDPTTAHLLAETALERPAYPVAIVVGLAAVVFYDG